MKVFTRLAAVAVAVSPFAAHAADGAIDTSAITSALTSVGVAAAAVGAAYLVVRVGIKGYKLLAGAL